jgi:hypothetical protein
VRATNATFTSFFSPPASNTNPSFGGAPAADLLSPFALRPPSPAGGACAATLAPLPVGPRGALVSDERRRIAEVGALYVGSLAPPRPVYASALDALAAEWGVAAGAAPTLDALPALARALAGVLAGRAAPAALLEVATQLRVLVGGGQARAAVEAVVAARVVPLLVQLLAARDARVQLQAAWALANIAAGQGASARAVADAGGVAALALLLPPPRAACARAETAFAEGGDVFCVQSAPLPPSSGAASPEEARWRARCAACAPPPQAPPPAAAAAGDEGAEELWDTAAHALGNLARDSDAIRASVVAHALPRLLACVAPPRAPGLPLLRRAAWAVKGACGGKAVPLPLVRQVAPAAAALLDSEDAEVQEHAAGALALCTSADANAEAVVAAAAGALLRAVALLAAPAVKVCFSAQRFLGNVISGSEAPTQAAIDAGALPAIGSLLARAAAVAAAAGAPPPPEGEGGVWEDIHKEGLWAVSNAFAAQPLQVEAALAAGLLPHVVAALAHPAARVQAEAAFCVASLAGRGAAAAAALLGSGALERLPAVLMAHCANAALARALLRGFNALLHSLPEGGRRGAALAQILAAGLPAAVGSLLADDGGAASDQLGVEIGLFLSCFPDLPAGDRLASALVVQRLAPGAPLKARLASCTACWARASPCRCAPEAVAADRECPICQEAEMRGPWTALACGHLFHERCILRWAAHATRAARALARLPRDACAVCPLDRKCITCVVKLPQGGGGEEPGHLRVVDLPEEEE